MKFPNLKAEKISVHCMGIFAYMQYLPCSASSSWCFEISRNLGDSGQNDNAITCHITGIIEKPER